MEGRLELPDSDGEGESVMDGVMESVVEVEEVSFWWGMEEVDEVRSLSRSFLVVPGDF